MTDLLLLLLPIYCVCCAVNLYAEAQGVRAPGASPSLPARVARKGPTACVLSRG